MNVKRVLNVGSCGPDNQAISRMLKEHFDVDVVHADSHELAWQQMESESFNLVLVNRVSDQDGSCGVALVREIKSDPGLADQPVMLVSNYGDAQQQAIQHGAQTGFGKSQLRSPATIQKIRDVLQ